MSQRQPWFKFWASDFLTDPDIDRLSLEAQAIVIRLWCLCTLHGGFPNDLEEVARLTRCRLQCIQQCWQQCIQHFRLEGDFWTSPRMERERAKSEVARHKAESRWNKTSSQNSNAFGNAGGNAESDAQKARKPEGQKKELEPEQKTLAQMPLAAIVQTERASGPSPVEAIYQAYPRKIAKAAALKAIGKAIANLQRDGRTEREAQEYLFRRTQAYSRSPAGQNGEFTPHPATWFNRGSFDDDDGEWRKTGNGAGTETFAERKHANTIDNGNGAIAILQNRARTHSAGNGHPGRDLAGVPGAHGH